MSLWTRKKWITTLETRRPLCEIIGGHVGHDTLEEARAYQAAFNADISHPDRSADAEYDYMTDPELNPRSDAECGRG